MKRNWAQNGLLAAILFVALALALAPSRTIAISPTYHHDQASSSPSPSPITHHDATSAWIASLIAYECTNSCIHNPHFRSLDDNGYYSYGCLQFQRDTWNLELRRFGRDLPVDASIYDCAAQQDLAYAMIKANPEAWTNWYTSVMRGAGFPPSI